MIEVREEEVGWNRGLASKRKSGSYLSLFISCVCYAERRTGREKAGERYEWGREEACRRRCIHRRKTTTVSRRFLFARCIAGRLARAFFPLASRLDDLLMETGFNRVTIITGSGQDRCTWLSALFVAPDAFRAFFVSRLLFSSVFDPPNRSSSETENPSALLLFPLLFSFLLV